MIIFGSLLTTFESIIIFGGSWCSIENWLDPKIEPPSGNLACPNPWNALYVNFNWVNSLRISFKMCFRNIHQQTLSFNLITLVFANFSKQRIDEINWNKKKEKKIVTKEELLNCLEYGLFLLFSKIKESGYYIFSKKLLSFIPIARLQVLFVFYLFIHYIII